MPTPWRLPCVSVCLLLVVLCVCRTRSDDRRTLLRKQLNSFLAQAENNDLATAAADRRNTGPSDNSLLKLGDGNEPSWHSHYRRSRQTMPSSSLFQGRTRPDINSQTLGRPHMTFEFPDYLINCDEDVPRGKVLYIAKLINRPPDAEPEITVDDGNFTARWDGNVVSIATNKTLDADDNAGFYHFVITAKIPGTGEKASSTVRVFVTNTNDEPPKFTQDIYTSNVDENAGPGTLVATVIATDKDGDKVTYGFSDGTTLYQFFEIDPRLGNIRLHRTSEFERDSYELRVTATDDGSCCPGKGLPIHTSTALVLVRIIDINDNKPVFEDCSRYEASVKENMPVGTHVIKVAATDKDRGPNGEVTYSIVMPANQHVQMFEIDRISGEVRTNKMFDREGEDGKSVSLTVKATDHGVPPLEGLCTLQVHISDVNDNSPAFDRILYSETISQNKQIGDTLFHVVASDLDADQNAKIVYSLQPKSTYPADSGYFFIDPDSGRVTLNKLLDKKKFNFFVVARDSGTPPLENRVEVVIEVISLDVLPPEWQNLPSGPVEVPENVTLNTHIVTIEALSGIPGNKKVIYKLFNGNTPQTNKKNTFVLREEHVGDKTIAHVVVNAALDYEEIKDYNLTIRAENADQLSLASEITLHISLADVNDEIPLFSKMEEGSVLENEPAGTKVYKITAHDRDGTVPFNTVTYSITEGSDKFEINRYDGQVTTRIPFDREKQMYYVISVVATDGAPSARPNMKPGVPNSNQESFKIRIGDRNDNDPIFARRLYEATVNENEDIRHPVITVTATDADESSTLKYQLTTGNEGGAFAVHDETGVVYVAGSIDYETKSLYVLTVVASDGLHEANTTLRIKILDLNDRAPTFNSSTYEVTLIEEDNDLPKKILTVYAQDGDKDRPQEIVYFLTGQGTSDPVYFTVTQTTGEISVLKPLDRDQPKGRPQWRFTVLAADEGGRKANGSMLGYAEVIVNLKDINDNSPEFPEKSYEGEVEENNPNPGELALVMTAVDNDDPKEGTNAILTYRIQRIENHQNNIFSIDEKDASIRTAVCCLDRETVDMYKIVVVATDGGGLTGTGTATIHIKDTNDNPPSFEKDRYDLVIDETVGNQIPTEPVLTVKVLDKDLPETNKNYFLVVQGSGPGWDRFSVVPAVHSKVPEGLLMIRRPLDYENEEHRRGFQFKILVDDTGGMSNDTKHFATAIVDIKIRDINDNDPVFDKSVLNVSIREDASQGFFVAKFSATDVDNDGRSVVRYAIERQSNRRRHFTIALDGTVKVHRPLDREENYRHEIRVLAIDDGKPSRTATATLIVNVLDVNDNPPVFCDDYRGMVMEDSSPGQVMDVNGQPLEIEACDRDDYKAGNGPPFTFVMSESASPDIREKFEVRYRPGGGHKNEGSAIVFVKKELDREQQKYYKIPITMTDSGTPQQTGTSTLTIIVGDKNDNGMKDGSTEITVYLFKGRAPDFAIGRVYADDPDDEDWRDKTFHWDSAPDSHFMLNEDTGEITMRTKTRKGTYVLYFTVSDPNWGTVKANVTVHVINIPEEAVMKSGSIRIKGTSEEEFVSVLDYKTQQIVPSKRELLQKKIAELIGARPENVLVFTVMKSAWPDMLDVRYAAHGSPYYNPEKLNGLLGEGREEVERDVQVEIELMGIDECLYENKQCEGSCSNDLIIYEKPYMITSKRTGFVGVHAFIQAKCYCRAREDFSREKCKPNPCYNGGTCNLEHNGIRCDCPKGFEGPRCQLTTRDFDGNGFAWFPPLQQCENSHLSLEFLTESPDGLLLYNGPTSEPNPHTPLVQDFISLELENGQPRLLLDFGSGTLELRVTQTSNLIDGAWHRIDLFWNPEEITMVVDRCRDLSETLRVGDTHYDRSPCEMKGTPIGFHEYLNVNGPLQLGGVQHRQLTGYAWELQHTRTRFKGCIKNIIHNSELYDMASPGIAENSHPGCSLLDVVCGTNEINPHCVHGSCLESTTSAATCLCYPGYSGSKCEYATPPGTFYNDSNVHYDLKFPVADSIHQYHSEIQLRYRSRWPDSTLMSVQGRGKAFMLLEIKNATLSFTFNLHDGRKEDQSVSLLHFHASDGYWHTVTVVRYGSFASLSVDGGGGKRYNETSPEDQGFSQMIQIPNEKSVLVGLLPDFNVLEQKDHFAKACMDDVRFDRVTYYLPMPPTQQESNYATAVSPYNIDAGCNSTACVNVVCPSLMECVDLFLLYECRCIAGYELNETGHCKDIDECELEFPGPCLNDGECVNLPGTFICKCPEPFTGDLCDVIQERREVKLSMGALAAILVCVLVVLLLALVLIIYTRNRRTNYGPVDPDDDIRENIINYNDEGGGEDDMHTYDIGPLRIPIDASGMPISPKAGPEKGHYPDPRQNRAYSPDDPDVGEFINNNLGKANDDPDALPMDDLRVYAYEGGGSDAGSLSSLASGTDDNEQDFDYLNGWGPRFQKLADMYGQGESEDE